MESASFFHIVYMKQTIRTFEIPTIESIDEGDAKNMGRGVSGCGKFVIFVVKKY